MDEAALGGWIAAQARAASANLHEQRPVDALTVDGQVTVAGQGEAYDAVVNAAGPWAEDLLLRRGIAPRYQLDLVRGSHILFAEPVSAGYFFQVPGESRVFFVLPYQGRTLVGTTEVRQGLAEPIACSEAEAAYLVKAYNAYMREPKRVEDIVASFAAVRPLIRSASDPGVPGVRARAPGSAADRVRGQVDHRPRPRAAGGPRRRPDGEGEPWSSLT